MTSKLTQATYDQIWGKEIANRVQKEKAARAIAKRLRDGDIVGVGSGTTSLITLKILADLSKAKGFTFTAITTSVEFDLACTSLNIPTTTLQLATPDWSFDGADEVDPKGNLIKGHGGAMFREKLVILASKEAYIVIDPSKRVPRLGVNFPVPIEVYPDAIGLVKQALKNVANITSITLRKSADTDKPVITDNGNLILDVKFSKIDERTEPSLKAITGVIETGLFMGFKTTIISS